MLITNNGPFGFSMLHPRYHVAKTYYVEVNDVLGPDAPAFLNPVLSLRMVLFVNPAQLEVLSSASDKSYASNHDFRRQVSSRKKDVLAYGVKVTYLKRISFWERFKR